MADQGWTGYQLNSGHLVLSSVWVLTELEVFLLGHPYSTFVISSTDPLRYSSLKNCHEVHGQWDFSLFTFMIAYPTIQDIGEVWDNMLHNVYAALLAVNGFSPTSQVTSTGTARNMLFQGHVGIETLQPHLYIFHTNLNCFINDFFLLPSCNCLWCMDPGWC